MQFAQGWTHGAPYRHAPQASSAPADDQRVAQQRAKISAELSARFLGRLSLLGQRIGTLTRLAPHRDQWRCAWRRDAAARDESGALVELCVARIGILQIGRNSFRIGALQSRIKDGATEAEPLQPRSNGDEGQIVVLLVRMVFFHRFGHGRTTSQSREAAEPNEERKEPQLFHEATRTGRSSGRQPSCADAAVVAHPDFAERNRARLEKPEKELL